LHKALQLLKFCKYKFMFPASVLLSSFLASHSSSFYSLLSKPTPIPYFNLFSLIRPAQAEMSHLV
jgi:hypothetical protein